MGPGGPRGLQNRRQSIGWGWFDSCHFRHIYPESLPAGTKRERA